MQWQSAPMRLRQRDVTLTPEDDLRLSVVAVCQVGLMEVTHPVAVLKVRNKRAIEVTERRRVKPCRVCRLYARMRRRPFLRPSPRCMVCTFGFETGFSERWERGSVLS